MLFITIAWRHIRFHATQSFLMVRCIKMSEGRRYSRCNVIEGVVALIWAAISMSFFGGIQELGEVMIAQKGNAAWVVNEISNSLLGRVGAILAILGVVAAPITSGDTAFRSARLTVGDLLKFNQKPIKNRLIITVPLFVVGFVLTTINFDVVWRYFAWSNQTLATVVLWTITVYLFQKGKGF